eukprot:m.232575 g.232575  ORF g.232575 m.232575 type:complete len:87 (+) comp15231_c1_seq3:359-619(+)
MYSYMPQAASSIASYSPITNLNQAIILFDGGLANIGFQTKDYLEITFTHQQFDLHCAFSVTVTTCHRLCFCCCWWLRCKVPNSQTP